MECRLTDCSAACESISKHAPVVPVSSSLSLKRFRRLKNRRQVFRAEHPHFISQVVDDRQGSDPQCLATRKKLQQKSLCRIVQQILGNWRKWKARWIDGSLS